MPIAADPLTAAQMFEYARKKPLLTVARAAAFLALISCERQDDYIYRGAVE